ncbi:MAG: SPASM domain-containing protein [Gemmatimonadetes bacterium]|nr:SPASM domain-containing protein [Gemmatimonadota bacterium]
MLRNVERFNEIRQTDYPGSGTTTRISGVAVEGTQDPEEMKAFWSNYVDQVTIGQEMPLADSYARVPVASSSVCRRLYESLYVWFDGVCNPCDFDYKSLLSPGNAKEQSITDIWLGKKFSRLRELHEARMRASLVPCDRCPL